MPTKTTKRKKTSPQMFNMGVFAIILVVTLILTVSLNEIITFLKGVEEQPDQAVTGDTGGREYKTYHLNNTMSGPLSFCSEAQPWSEGEVDGVFSTLVPLYSYCQGEDAPFQIANMQLYGKGDGVYALTQLALGVRGMFPHITPVVTGAYLPYAEAREGAGTSPFHTGYAFTLSFKSASS